MNNIGKNLALWAIIAVLLVALFNLFQSPSTRSGQSQLAFSDFLAEVQQGRVTEVTIQGPNITGRLSDNRTFTTYSPQDPGLVDRLVKQNVRIIAAPIDDGPTGILSILISWFPMLLFIGVWIFFMRQMQSGGGKAMGFGKSRARLLTEKVGRVTFDDVAGIEEAKQELNEILRSAGNTNVDDPDFNPVKKVPVVVSGDEGSVFIELIDEELAVVGTNNRIAGGTGIREQLLTLQSGISQLRRDSQDIKLTQGVDRSTIMNELKMIHRNIKRIGNQPGRMMAAAAGQRAENLNLLAGVVAGRADVIEPPTASLSPMPRNLFELWREYSHGIGGRKPAELFSHHEKGRVKHKYHRRNVVWRIIDGLIKRGFTAETAIDRIHAIYGSQTSVTNIINGLKRDKKAGTLSPSLRVVAR